MWGMQRICREKGPRKTCPLGNVAAVGSLLFPINGAYLRILLVIWSYHANLRWSYSRRFMLPMSRCCVRYHSTAFSLFLLSSLSPLFPFPLIWSNRMSVGDWGKVGHPSVATGSILQLWRTTPSVLYRPRFVRTFGSVSQSGFTEDLWSFSESTHRSKKTYNLIFVSKVEDHQIETVSMGLQVKEYISFFLVRIRMPIMGSTAWSPVNSHEKNLASHSQLMKRLTPFGNPGLLVLSYGATARLRARTCVELLWLHTCLARKNRETTQRKPLRGKSKKGKYGTAP